VLFSLEFSVLFFPGGQTAQVSDNAAEDALEEIDYFGDLFGRIFVAAEQEIHVDEEFSAEVLGGFPGIEPIQVAGNEGFEDFSFIAEALDAEVHIVSQGYVFLAGVSRGVNLEGVHAVAPGSGPLHRKKAKIICEFTYSVPRGAPPIIVQLHLSGGFVYVYDSRYLPLIHSIHRVNISALDKAILYRVLMKHFLLILKIVSFPSL